MIFLAREMCYTFGPGRLDGSPLVLQRVRIADDFVMVFATQSIEEGP